MNSKNQIIEGTTKKSFESVQREIDKLKKQRLII